MITSTGAHDFRLYGSTLHAHYMTHHISFLCEDSIVETLQGHPFVGQLHIGSVVLSEVAASIHILSQTKVSHPDTPSRVQPIGMYRRNHTETLYRQTITFIMSIYNFEAVTAVTICKQCVLYKLWMLAYLWYKLSLVSSHAVSGCKVSMDKLLLSQVGHSQCYLTTHLK